jgi:hypothetical protein
MRRHAVIGDRWANHRLQTLLSSSAVVTKNHRRHLDGFGIQLRAGDFAGTRPMTAYYSGVLGRSRREGVESGGCGRSLEKAESKRIDISQNSLGGGTLGPGQRMHDCVVSVGNGADSVSTANRENDLFAAGALDCACAAEILGNHAAGRLALGIEARIAGHIGNFMNAGEPQGPGADHQHPANGDIEQHPWNCKSPTESFFVCSFHFFHRWQ